MSGVFEAMSVISGALTSATPPITGAVTGTGQVISGEMTIPSAPAPNYFEGEYDLTPSDTVQTIQIEGLTARQDITINPIPSNYGLITWDGSTITVS